MRKLIFLLFVFSIMQSSAQLFTGGINLGIAGGQIDGDEMWGYNHLGLILGGFTDIHLSDNKYIELGLRYTGKGATQALKYVTKGYSRAKVDLHYIDIPLLFTYVLNQKYDLQLGLLSGYLFKTKMISSAGNIVDESLYSFHAWDFDGITGIYYPWRENFKFGVHFVYSLHFISETPKQSNNLINISAKYYIGKK